MADPHATDDTPEQVSADAPPRERRLVFESLARGEKEIEIEHHGQIYRLRLTRNDKLILSK